MKNVFNNLLTPFEAAQKLFCNERTLANWRCQEKGPRFTKMPNGRVYYPEEEVELFLKDYMSENKTHNSKLILWNDLEI